MQALSLRAAQLQNLTVREADSGQLFSEIDVDGERWTLALEPYSIRAADFQVLVETDAGGQLVAVDPPPARTYRGHVLERPEARVAAHFVDGKLTAAILTAKGVRGVQPVADLGLGGAANEHVIYRAEDWVSAEEHTCGTTAALALVDPDLGGVAGVVAGTGYKIADLAVDADREFFSRNGGSISATIHDIENVLNTVEFIYERDTDIAYEVTTIIVRTVEPDPYNSTDALALLCELRSEWNAVPQTYIRRDTTHLFTGKNLVGSTIGIAWVGVMCNANGFSSGCGSSGNLAYGLSESKFTSTFTSRVALTAHEIGHNWNAGHCTGGTCHIMCASLGSCGGIGGSNLKFGPAATSQIVNFKNTRGCLADLADPEPLPFVDDFPSTTFDTGKWSYRFGPAITSNAMGEPSEPFALNLDAAGTQDFRDDEIRSNFVLLGASAEPVVSYYTQHRGVSAGGALVVEYWSNSLAWQELNRIESDGTDQSEFVSHMHSLPQDAKHDEFRLRFRTEVDGGTEDWFVDDVLIRDGCGGDADCDDGIFCNGAETCVTAACAVGTKPCLEEGRCDEALDQCFDPGCSLPAVDGEGGRYVAITPPADMGPVGLLVAPLCDGASVMYLGVPSGWQNIAQTVDGPESAAYLSFEQWGGTVHVTDPTIVPDTEYFARTDCGTPDTPSLSASVLAVTQIYGDTVGAFDGEAWTPPDGVVDFGDITAAVDKFRSLPTAPSLFQCDLMGCSTNEIVDFVDISGVVDGFRGVTYTESTGCPVPCGK